MARNYIWSSQRLNTWIVIIQHRHMQFVFALQKIVVLLTTQMTGHHILAEAENV